MILTSLILLYHSSLFRKISLWHKFWLIWQPLHSLLCILTSSIISLSQQRNTYCLNLVRVLAILLREQRTISKTSVSGVKWTFVKRFDSTEACFDHLAWSESSAVSYANSVIGARTNREGGPSALAAALVGKTALYGYHLDENRRPTHRIEVEGDLRGSDYGALGFLVGGIVRDGVPFFRLNGLKTAPGKGELKALGASMAASGSVALYYVEDATPAPASRGEEEMISLGRREIEEVYAAHSGDEAEAVALGCPHCSAEELEKIARRLEGQKVVKEMWVCTARKTAEQNPHLVRIIEESGARVYCDTCMVVSPASEKLGKIMVNSGKALAYLPGLAGVKAGLGSIEECIDAALGRR